MRPPSIGVVWRFNHRAIRRTRWVGSSSSRYIFSKGEADVVLRGYDKYNTRWAQFLLRRLFPFECTNPPVATTIFFGANDAALSGRHYKHFHVPVEEYKENLRRMVHHLKKCSPTMLVVLITPPPVDEEGRLEYASGGLHLTEEGNAVLHQEVVRVFNEASLCASAMPYDFPHHSEIDWKDPSKSF